MNKSVKVVYYVDTEDNTKGCLCAIPSDKDLCNLDIVELISKEIHSYGFDESLGVCNSVAWEIAHHGRMVLLSRMGKYEFGVEEVPLIEY